MAFFFSCAGNIVATNLYGSAFGEDSIGIDAQPIVDKLSIRSSAFSGSTALLSFATKASFIATQFTGSVFNEVGTLVIVASEVSGGVSRDTINCIGAYNNTGASLNSTCDLTIIPP